MTNFSQRKRLGLILALGLVLLCIGIFYERYFLSRPIGHGPAGPKVERSAFANSWTHRRVKIVGIGDSITAGLGAKSPDHTFFNRLIRNPSDEFEDMNGVCLTAVIPNLEFENLAISGSTSETHLSVIQDRLAVHDADIFGLIVITSGGNDLIHSYGRSPPKECAMYGATLVQAEDWIASFKTRLDAILDAISDRFPGGCEIFLGNIYDPTDGIGDAPSVYLPHWPDGLAIHARYNKVIADCAASRRNVYVVPLYESFLGHGAHCRQFWRRNYDSGDPHYWFYDNIEDPNDRGYDAIRRVFLNEILERSILSPAKVTYRDANWQQVASRTCSPSGGIFHSDSGRRESRIDCRKITGYALLLEKCCWLEEFGRCEF